MKIKSIRNVALGLSLMAAVSCTSDFEKINTNPQGANDKETAQDFGNVRGPLKVMFVNILVQMPEWWYQVQQNLQGDIWSGYMATGTAFAGGSNNTTYNLIDSWNGFAWASAYTSEMANFSKVETLTKGKYDDVYAMSLVLKVEAMHRVTDIYGPIVYSKFGTTDSTIGYDSQEEVYTKMFSELDFAVTELSKQADANVKNLSKVDLSTYAGSFEKWTRFANSLRLRLATRLSKVNPTLAKAEAQKALTQKYGVITNAADSFAYVSQTPNAIKTISAGWHDILMSADMESIMGGYNDPRIGKFFAPSKDFPGQYKGVRTGIEINAKSDHEGFSLIGSVGESNTITFMTAAEVYFLRAEAALRGWDAGSAQTYYEAGIAASFTQHGVSDAAYITDNVKTAKAYVDPNFPVNNSAAVNNVTVAWDGAASNEVKLQKIITQKWIANFPEGQEAWSEYRRTGYPKLFPVLKNTSGGTITTQYGVRRVNFVQSEKDGNPGGILTALAKLGGPDNGGTRLWWDTTGPNF